MNLRLFSFAALVLLGSPGAPAQNAADSLPQDPAREILRNLSERDTARSNKSATAQPEPESPPAAPDAAKPPATPAPEASADPSAKETPPADAPETPTTPDTAEVPAPRQGPEVRVEKLQTGDGHIDPSQVKLRAPFPAKPLAAAPVGWSLVTSKNAPPFTREVELTPGNKITLTIRPHLLVPNADGASVFNVPEPGFDSARGYHQIATVSAILSNSLQQLEHDSKALGTAIDDLQQILVSLPKPPPPEQVNPSLSIESKAPIKPALRRKP